MANKENDYKITNAGSQVVEAPNKQPKDTSVTVQRGTDLRSGK